MTRQIRSLLDYRELLLRGLSETFWGFSKVFWGFSETFWGFSETFLMGVIMNVFKGLSRTFLEDYKKCFLGDYQERFGDYQKHFLRGLS